MGYSRMKGNNKNVLGSKAKKAQLEAECAERPESMPS